MGSAIPNSDPLYRQVMKRLLSDIEQGVLKPEDRLPSESQLMQHFGVSRVTVRQALDELVSRGVIVKSKGKGSFVRDPNSGAASDPDNPYVGLIVPYVDAPHMSSLLSNLEVELKKLGYRAVLCNSHDDPLEEARHLDELAKQGVNGFIWYPTSFMISSQAAKRLLKAGTPFVLIDRYFPRLACDFVVSDNYKGAYDMVTYLIEQGCKHIAYLTNSPVYPTARRERFKGYQRALEDHGLSFSEKVILVEGDNSEAVPEIRDSLSRLPGLDAVFVSSVPIVLQLLLVMHEMGLKAPDNIRVACFDGYGPAVPVDVDLTSANQVMAKIASEAVHCLARRLSGQASEPQQHFIAPVFHKGNTA